MCFIFFRQLFYDEQRDSPRLTPKGVARDRLLVHILFNKKPLQKRRGFKEPIEGLPSSNAKKGVARDRLLVHILFNKKPLQKRRGFKEPIEGLEPTTC